jgi:hypothetical protein
MKYDKAQGIVIAPIWPGQSWYTKLKNLSIKFLFFGLSGNSGNRSENERQGSKASIRQCGRLPSGPVADVGRDLLMIYM